MRKYLGLLAGAVAYFTVACAGAATVSNNFVFFNGSDVVASGSFSYDSSSSGLLSFADLTAFNIAGPAQSYGLSFVQSVVGYSYFGYDTTLNSFVPAQVLDTYAIFAATDTVSGFLFDPLVSQGGDGLFAFYNPPNCGACEQPSDFASFTSFTVSAVPELSTWVMTILGFLGLAFIGNDRRFKWVATN
jgi:hypothetical protein